MLLYVLFVWCKLCYIDQAALGTLEVAVLDVDHTQVVSRLDVVRFLLQYPAEARLGGGQVAVMVDVNVTHQDQPLAVVRVVLRQQSTHLMNN